MRLAATATALSCLAIATLAQSALSLTVLLIVGGIANALGGPRQGLAFGAQSWPHCKGRFRGATVGHVRNTLLNRAADAR